MGIFLLIAVIQPCVLLNGQAQKKTAAKSSTAETQTGSKSERLSHFEAAEKLLKEGKFLESIGEYKLSLADHPENEAAYFGMALAQAQASFPADAAQSYEAALKINPQLWEAEINWGMLLFSQQDFSNAVIHFRKAQNLNTKSFQSYYLAAKTLESLGRPLEAESSYLEALPLAQEDLEKADVHASLGAIYFKDKKWNESEKQLLAARQLKRSTNEAKGEFSPLDLELAQLYFETGQTDKSVAFLKPFADGHPEDPEVQELMARILYQKGDLEAAIKSYELAMKHQPERDRRQSLLMQLAEAYQQLGRTAEAIQLIQELSKTSSDPKIHFNLGTLQLHQKEYMAAEQSFLRALQLKPDFVECYSNLGSVLMLQEKYPEAIGAFLRFRQLRPEIPGTYFYLGIAYDKLNDAAKALSYYQRFLELDQGKSDKQTFQAKERMKVLEKKIKKR